MNLFRTSLADENEVENGSNVGPLSEDDELLLICETEGGKPTPSVQWWNGSSQIPGEFLVYNSYCLNSSIFIIVVNNIPGRYRENYMTNRYSNNFQTLAVCLRNSNSLNFGFRILPIL